MYDRVWRGGDRVAQKKQENKPASVSIVAPVYNEINSIRLFHERLQDVSAGWDRDHEIIYVDDGSTDGTTEYLRSLPEQNPRIRVARFSRNFGQQSAVTGGFDLSRGDIVLTIDVDLQVVPEDIPRLIEKMDEGFDIVAGYRPERKEKWLLRRLPSRLANLFFKTVFKLPYRDLGCGIQAFRKRVIEGVDPFSPMYPHRAIYACWRGGRFADIPIEYHPRTLGSAKYNFFKLLHFFLDILLTFMLRQNELLVAFVSGAIAAGIGLAGIFAAIIMSLASAPGTFPVLVLSLFMLFSGQTLILFGFMNERINRINHQINKSPLYVIDMIWGKPVPLGGTRENTGDTA